MKYPIVMRTRPNFRLALANKKIMMYVGVVEDVFHEEQADNRGGAGQGGEHSQISSVRKVRFFIVVICLAHLKCVFYALKS